MLTPRYYQSGANAAVWNYLCNDQGNPLVVLPTGAGKSLVIALLIEQARKFDGRVIVLQHRKELIEQNAAELRELMPGVDVGIYSAGLKSRQTTHDVLMAGIQSIFRKASEIGERHLVIIDEAHLVSQDDETMYGQFLSELKALNPKCRVTGLTATPFRTGEGPLCGRNKLFQRVVYEAFTGDLIEQGFLCPITNKVADAEVNTEGIKTRGGEFIESDMQAVFGTVDNVKSACVETVARCQGRASILIFASGVKHAEDVAGLISTITNERVGLVTGETLPIERSGLLSDFKGGSLRWLVNCDVLCLDEKTEILTRSGWTTIDEMTESHQIASWDFDGSIKFAPPKLIVKRLRHSSERMVSLKSNGIDIRVTDNHRMVTWKGSDDSGGWSVVPAKNLVNRKVRLPAHGTAAPCEMECEQNSVSEKTRLARIRTLSCVYRKKYGMDDAESKHAASVGVDARMNMQFKNPSDLTADECRFIGFWIGDGTKSGGRITIAQSTAYKRNIQWVEDLLYRSGIHYTKSLYKADKKSTHGSVRWCFSKGTGGVGQLVSGGINHLIPYLEKDGSRLFWGLNEIQFEALLEGWWRADGLHHAKRADRRVSCVNKKLIDLLQAVATCRGIRTSLRVCSKPRSEKHSQQYTLSWSRRSCINVFRNRFQYDETPIKDGERVWCVTSITGNIITRRNGKVAVVGNTTGFNAKCVDAIAIMRATMSPGLFCQMVGRGLRLHPAKQNTLILDYGQNIARHGSIDDKNFGRASEEKRGQAARAAALNGRGKPCPACGLDVASNARECECGFIFPVNHQGSADASSQLTGQMPPEVWTVVGVGWGKHTKRGAPEAPPTLRIDYECRPVDSEGGLLKTKVSEWVCLQHQGFARLKAIGWWQCRSISEVPDTVEEAVSLLNRGAARMSAQLTTIKDGKYTRIQSCEFAEERPEEWEEEQEEESFGEFSGVENDVPF